MTEEAYGAVAERFRVLGEPLRLKLLDRLRTGECTVGELAEATGTSQPNASRHLSTLARAGMVVRRRAGTTVYYAIADPSVFDLCEIVCGGIERHLERRSRALGPA